MTGFRLTPHARRHVIEILEFSIAQWGERRADRYIQAIDAAIAAVARGEIKARDCEQYGAGLRFVRSGSHNIYLR
ncbi:type II toxin-antitoxin system RelE/ParE family toxin [Vitreimonas sp.]|uniref:type II toxin-antitoxin system RelE/ParE family toxin n=1 Tax=Vitreimonas sp. TaxID=3069702 RepID=UPI0039C967C4